MVTSTSSLYLAAFNNIQEYNTMVDVGVVLLPDGDGHQYRPSHACVTRSLSFTCGIGRQLANIVA